jgi:hypothetical protein
MEVWQSPVYCTCLENRRIERYREFESHRFRQIGEKMLILTTMLTMIFYWVLFGLSVTAFLFVMYGIAIVSGVLAELVEGTFLLRKHTP